MNWNVITFETPRGEKPLDRFIKSQEPQARSKIIHNIRLLEEHGNMLGMPHAKILSKGLYELRIRGKEELRILYCFRKKSIYLLHAFKKQTRSTPVRELSLAIKRMKEADLIEVDKT
ncbi:MAG: type II toxin-antitoxin system RelE/ParE family toxin [Patescibacteria group bacterium]